MKPKNRVMCPDCGREKILFESEKKAKNFIKFNGSELVDDISKLRVYYCPACCGYHISSHEYKGGNRTDKLIERYKKDLNAEQKWETRKQSNTEI